MALETVRFTAMLVVAGTIFRYGKLQATTPTSGLNYILAGFALLFVGSLVDVADDYEWTGSMATIFCAEWAVILEKVVGHFGGFILFAIGSWSGFR